jgi:long-chain-acyl-CoA dehydrogenase
MARFHRSRAQCKYWCTDLQSRAADIGVQLHGGWGCATGPGQAGLHQHAPTLHPLLLRVRYMWEYPICRAFADARVQSIYGGANEIMKELIARSI